MGNTIRKTNGTQGRPLRQLPGWQIVRRCRRAGLTQWEIAKGAGVSQGTVANAINHHHRTGPAVERVWLYLETHLGK